METHNIIRFLNTCITQQCEEPAGFTSFETNVYLAFCVFNVGRIFTYFPTISKLRAQGCSGDGQSVWTWVCWIFANSTLSYYAYIAAKYQVTDFVWINILNTLMCFMCLYYVIKVQNRAGTLNWVPFSKLKQNNLLTIRISEDLRQPITEAAHKTGIPINILVAQAVTEFIAAHERKSVPNDQLFQIPQ